MLLHDLTRLYLQTSWDSSSKLVGLACSPDLSRQSGRLQVILKSFNV